MVDTGPRVIGNYLHDNKDPVTIPCHRVVHSDGRLAAGYVFGGEDKQRNLLEGEGVVFRKNKVVLDKSAWTPI